jgi:hypothetical protein
MKSNQLDGLWRNENDQTETLRIKNGTIISLVLQDIEKIPTTSLLRKIEHNPTDYSHFSDIDNKKVIILVQPSILELYEMNEDIYGYNDRLKIGRFIKIQ